MSSAVLSRWQTSRKHSTTWTTVLYVLVFAVYGAFVISTVPGVRPHAGYNVLLDGFLNEVVGPPAILVGNSMGGLISVLQTNAHPETVAGLVLVDPALPVGVRARPHPLVALLFALYAVPAVGRTLMSRRRAIRSVEDQAMDVLRLC